MGLTATSRESALTRRVHLGERIVQHIWSARRACAAERWPTAVGDGPSAIEGDPAASSFRSMSPEAMRCFWAPMEVSSDSVVYDRSIASSRALASASDDGAAGCSDDGEVGDEETAGPK